MLTIQAGDDVVVVVAVVVVVGAATLHGRMHVDNSNFGLRWKWNTPWIINLVLCMMLI